jgi:uncharacterized protein YecT (DUF1311 family)
MKLAQVALLVLIAIGVPSRWAAAQSPQAEMQRRLTEWRDQRYRIVGRADAAWDREMAREKAGDCLSSTSAEEITCLMKEIDTTKGNLTEYAGAFHAIFALAAPDEAAWQVPGPTGKPLAAAEMAGAFNEVESAWEKYRVALCSAAFGLDKGGTVAPISAAYCELRAMRNHMRELGAVLGGTFHQ